MIVYGWVDASARMQIRIYREQDEAEVVALWERCALTRPWNDPHKDIQRKLVRQPELFFVALLDACLIGTAMAGYEGHRGWVNYLAIDPLARNRGYGRRLMEHVERALLELGCPKLNLQIRSSNTAVIEFYKRLGYAVDDAVCLGKRLIHD